ncbi:MAG: 16S rRNA (adenine1518-N6/adenine1519-N6)-dimethyltransferase, partial [Lysobacterales bacterium]
MTFRTKKTTGHRIKKSFGQNFLTDLLIKDRIISSCDLHEDDIVLEIGPGEGAITELIAPR